MALIFSEAFESTLVAAFWPPAQRSGSLNFVSFGRTNNMLSLPASNETNVSANDNSFVTLNFAPIATQTNKKLFLGFAARDFKTKAGSSDGSVTARQNFLRLLDADGAPAVTMAFEKNSGTEAFFLLTVLDSADAPVATYVLSNIIATRHIVGACNASIETSNTLHQTDGTRWYYFEFEFDLSAATPTVKLWINSTRITTTDNANQIEIPDLTAISGIQLHGNRLTTCRDNTSIGRSTQFDDLYVSDNLPESYNPQTATRLITRLGPAKIYTSTFSDTGAKTTNWTAVNTSSGSPFFDVLNVEDGNDKYAASNLLGAELVTRFNGPASIASFERIAAVQMIYSAAAAGSLPAALIPVIDNNTSGSTGVPIEAAATVFEPDSGFVTKIVTAQTDPIADPPTAFTATSLTSTVSTNAGRRIGLRVAAVPES